jgi:hypothetical protein
MPKKNEKKKWKIKRNSKREETDVLAIYLISSKSVERGETGHWPKRGEVLSPHHILIFILSILWVATTP